MSTWLVIAVVICAGLITSSCTRTNVDAATAGTAPSEVNTGELTVGTVPVITRPMAQHLTVSSELVPFQEIDVYAKEAGYVKELNVDYGTHVKAGQVMAVLEIPELEAQLAQDKAAITAQQDEITREEHEVNRTKAQSNVAQLQYHRLADVAKTKKGLVAQQEVDDAEGKYLAADAQVQATQGALAAAKSQLAVAQAKLNHDEALYAYSKITAPFEGVVTQRYANYGALMQAGNSSTQATPLVRLSQENLYRLVIPVPETYVRYIKVGDPVTVNVPSLDRKFVGKVTRFSVEVAASTRTMHTEVDVPNVNNLLVPGMYAEALLTLDEKPHALAVPLQAIDHVGEQTFVDVVSSDGRLEQRKVLTGIQGTNYAEIANGLHAGEQVIVSDRGGLKPGQQVKPHPVQGITYEDTQDQ